MTVQGVIRSTKKTQCEQRRQASEWKRLAGREEERQDLEVKMSDTFVRHFSFVSAPTRHEWAAVPSLCNRTDLSGYRQSDLNAHAQRRNTRPRKLLTLSAPLEPFSHLRHHLSLAPIT